jgi:hypothetical protein
MEKKYAKQGFELVWISLDDDAKAHERMVKRLRMRGKLICEGKGLDGALGQLYGLDDVYETFLIGRDGVITAVDLHDDELDRAIAAALTR